MMVNSPSVLTVFFHQAMDLLWSFLRRTPAEAQFSGVRMGKLKTRNHENQKHRMGKLIITNNYGEIMGNICIYDMFEYPEN